MCNALITTVQVMATIALSTMAIALAVVVSLLCIDAYYSEEK